MVYPVAALAVSHDWSGGWSAEPPSWRRCWIDAGHLLPRMFPDHEAIGLARLQNDLLIALTARHTGTLLVTSDPHFTALRRHVPFTVKVLPAGEYDARSQGCCGIPDWVQRTSR